MDGITPAMVFAAAFIAGSLGGYGSVTRTEQVFTWRLAISVMLNFGGGGLGIALFGFWCLGGELGNGTKALLVAAAWGLGLGGWKMLDFVLELFRGAVKLIGERGKPS